MNDLDRAGRYWVKNGPDEAKRWLLPRTPEAMRFRGWKDAQSAPRPGEQDRRCDTIMVLDDQENPPWVAIFELFSQPDADAVDRALEYQARYRRELRHGPHDRDRYPFAVVLLFFSGAPGEKRLDMYLPGMPEVGSWFGLHVLDVSGEDAIAHADAIAQNRLTPWHAVWLPLMQGGQTEAMAQRWRMLVELDPRVKTLADLTCIFARHAACEDIYKKEMEGIMLQVSPFMEEVRIEERIKERRQATLEALLERFSGAVPEDVIARIKAETDIVKLTRWRKQAITATLEKFLEEM